MPRYFFNTDDGHAFSDEEGTELADLTATRLAAIQLTGQILKDEKEAFWRTGEWHLHVSDESGSVLFRLDVAASEGIGRSDA